MNSTIIIAFSFRHRIFPTIISRMMNYILVELILPLSLGYVNLIMYFVAPSSRSHSTMRTFLLQKRSTNLAQ